MAIQRWEYRRHVKSGAALETLDKFLNELGADGWEVCGYAASDCWTEVCLKRPVVSQAPTCEELERMVAEVAR